MAKPPDSFSSCPRPAKRRAPPQERVGNAAPNGLDGPFSRYLSVKDLSRVLQLSRSSIYRMYRAGQIPYVRVRNRVRFDALAVKSAIDKMS